jgi:ATP-dependent Clp protease ATP-binding subunit ClpA
MVRLTDEARHAFTCAQAEARRMRDSRVGTGHLLLGLLSDASGPSARALADLGMTTRVVERALARTAIDPTAELGPADVDALRAIGIDLDEVRERVEASFGPGALTPSVPRRRRPRLTDRAKEVWSASVRETRRLGHGFLGSEHLLLGLNDIEAGAGAQILRHAGVSGSSVRIRVIEELRRAS